MNMIDGTIEGNVAHLGSSVRMLLTGHLAHLASGRYRFGIRANHLSIVPGTTEDIAFDAAIELAEMSGSETFIHVTHNGVGWVVQTDGVHSLDLGTKVRVYLNPRFLFVFNQTGRLVAAPTKKGSLLSSDQVINYGKY